MAAKASDFTGRQREELAKKAAAEGRLRDKELTMATHAEQVAKETELVDLTNGPGAPEVVDTSDKPEIVDEVLDEGVNLSEQKYVVIRVNEDVENMTLGLGPDWNFEMGRKYRVPAYVAAHLEALGRLWH